MPTYPERSTLPAERRIALAYGHTAAHGTLYTVSREDVPRMYVDGRRLDPLELFDPELYAFCEGGIRSMCALWESGRVPEDVGLTIFSTSDNCKASTFVKCSVKRRGREKLPVSGHARRFVSAVLNLGWEVNERNLQAALNQEGIGKFLAFTIEGSGVQLNIARPSADRVVAGVATLDAALAAIGENAIAELEETLLAVQACLGLTNTASHSPAIAGIREALWNSVVERLVPLRGRLHFLYADEALRGPKSTLTYSPAMHMFPM